MKTGKNSLDMLNGSLLDKILIFALPFAASSILQQVFNSADVAVVGRFAGSTSLAAVGNNAPIINLIINIFVGMSLGANVLIASLIGQDRKDEIKSAVQTVVSVAAISGILLAAAGPAISRPILEKIGTPPEVLELASLYLRIYFLGMPAVMFYNFGSAVLRSKGDSKRPLYSLAVAGILNVLLNLVFVVVFHLGVAGVAVSTVTANYVSALLVFRFLLNESEPFRPDIRKLRINQRQFLKICRIGIPAGLQGMVFCFSNICIQGGINTFGYNAMAGSAAALNFEYFSYFVVSAFTQAATTFTSQNFGARKFSRCKKIYRLSMMCSILIAGFMCFVFVFFRNSLVRLYTTDSDVLPFALTRIVYVESLEFLTSTYEITAGALRGMGCSMLPAVLTLAGSCFIRLVWLATVFKKFPEFTTIMSVYPVSWVITGTAVITAYVIIRKRKFHGAE
ncbi:MATE family efflux transporter [Treponema sp.]|uniref:MATE family efflux transporter n=1 Tax=Treponema sp. TaxID=166 RepID=UPI003F04AE5C